jgi:hypothetical protein
MATMAKNGGSLVMHALGPAQPNVNISRPYMFQARLGMRQGSIA